MTGPHRAGRLNSGVRPQNQRSGQKKLFKKFFDYRRPTLEQPRPVSGIAKTRYASAVGCGFTQAKALSVPGLPGQKFTSPFGTSIPISRPTKQSRKFGQPWIAMTHLLSLMHLTTVPLGRTSRTRWQSISKSNGLADLSPNNSLKPRPLRGLGAVWQACTPRRGRKAARLSSGVRPQNQRSGQRVLKENF